MRRLLSLALIVMMLSRPTQAGWIKNIVDIGTGAYDATQQSFADLAKMVSILTDMQAINEEQNRAIQEMYAFYRRTGEGQTFKDEVDDIYTWEVRRTRRNVRALSEIGDRLALPSDYVADVEAGISQVAHDYYYGKPEIDESIKSNIASLQRDRNQINALSDVGRDQLLVKQNAQQVATQQQILDYTYQVAENTYKTQLLQELDRLEAQKENDKKKEAFEFDTGRRDHSALRRFVGRVTR